VLAQYAAEIVPLTPQLPCQARDAAHTGLTLHIQGDVGHRAASSAACMLRPSSVQLTSKNQVAACREHCSCKRSYSRYSQQFVSGTLRHCRLQVIHADGNESNILVDDRMPAGTPRVTGILDFGDFGHTWRVAEPAILLLYVLLLAADPVAAAVATLVRSRLAAAHRPEQQIRILDGWISMLAVAATHTSQRLR